MFYLEEPLTAVIAQLKCSSSFTNNFTTKSACMFFANSITNIVVMSLQVNTAVSGRY